MEIIPENELKEALEILTSNTKELLEYYSTSTDLPIPARQDAGHLLEKMRKQDDS